MTAPSNSSDLRVAVIGGGLVGLGTAYALQRLMDGCRVEVHEKESTLGAHQSTHNSGVLHAGLYYRPGSRKAALAVRGIRLMREYAESRGVAHEICGKLVVAVKDGEVPRLRALLERGRENGLAGVRMLGADEIREREPNVRAVEAVLVPDEGIIDYAGVVSAMAADISGGGGQTLTSSPLRRAVRIGRAWRLTVGDREVEADFIVNCAGLQSDRVARLLGASPTTRIVPFRGEYFTLARPELVRHLVYPVPDPDFPFLGVHYTRMIGGGVECGPNAVLSLSREGYARGSIRPRDALDAVTFRGLWRFIARYPGATAFELRRSLIRSVFVESLRGLVPEVRGDDLLPGPVGIRAQAMRPDGSLVEDFEFARQETALHVLNAPSPGATASLAIGEVIAQEVATALGRPLRATRLD